MDVQFKSLKVVFFFFKLWLAIEMLKSVPLGTTLLCSGNLFSTLLTKHTKFYD